jgi:hypothetical protein
MKYVLTITVEQSEFGDHWMCYDSLWPVHVVHGDSADEAYDKYMAERIECGYPVKQNFEVVA